MKQQLIIGCGNKQTNIINVMVTYMDVKLQGLSYPISLFLFYQIIRMTMKLLMSEHMDMK